MKPIVHIPSVILARKSEPVTRFDNKLTKLIDEMKNTLIAARNPRGVGLAAPQIGVPTRIFLARENAKSAIKIFINPKIIYKSELHDQKKAKEEKRLEGCLSVPNIWGIINRSQIVEIIYQDETGKSYKEKITGFLAVIIQHEVDHLEGILFTQRVLEQKGKLYQSVIDKDGKEALEEIEIK